MLKRVKDGGGKLPSFESKYDKVCKDIVEKLDGQMENDGKTITFKNSPVKIELKNDRHSMMMGFEEMDDHVVELIKIIVGNDEEAEEFFKIFKLKDEQGLLRPGLFSQSSPTDQYRGVVGIFSDVPISLVPHRLGGFMLYVNSF